MKSYCFFSLALIAILSVPVLAHASTELECLLTSEVEGAVKGAPATAIVNSATQVIGVDSANPVTEVTHPNAPVAISSYGPSATGQASASITFKNKSNDIRWQPFLDSNVTAELNSASRLVMKFTIGTNPTITDVRELGTPPGTVINLTQNGILNNGELGQKISGVTYKAMCYVKITVATVAK